MNTETTDTRFALGTWLRGLGAITFVGAGAVFLQEGVADAGTLRRELLWTAVTLALSFAGVFVARAARDAAAARVWLGLAAATIPTHFAQVGGQVWSYHVEGTESLSGVVVGCALLVLLAPPLSIGISVLVRGRGVLLTTLLFVLSCPLLVPTRQGDLIAASVLAEISILLALELTVFRGDPRMNTFEGLAARAMLLAPSAILLLRNGFHPGTQAWAAALVLTPSIVLLALPRLTSLRGPLPRALQALSVVGVALGVVIFCGSEPWVGLVLSVVGLLGTFVALDEPRIFAVTGAGALALSIACASVYGDASILWLTAPVGVLHVLAAHRLRSLPLLIVSVLASTLGMLVQLAPMVRLPSHDRWIVIAGVGMALLLSATIVERYRSRLERSWSRLALQFGHANDANRSSTDEAFVSGPEAPPAAGIYR